MDLRRSFTMGAVVSACVLLSVSARAQDPKIFLDADDISAAPGEQIMLSVFIENLPDTIAAYQLRLSMSRPDIAEFVPTISTTGTLTDGWGGGATTITGHDLRITSGAGVPPFWDPILPNTSGVLVQAVIEMYCDIPDTMQDRTLLIELSPVNTYFSNPQGVLVEPVDLSGGSVIAGSRCPHQGDSEPDGFVTSIDLSALISALYEGGDNPQDSCCPVSRYDLDCDGFPTSLDLSRMIDHLYAGGPGPCTP